MYNGCSHLFRFTVKDSGLHHREFTIADEYHYNHRTAPRWVLSHVLRYPVLPTLFLITVIGMAVAQSLGAVFVGRAFDTLLNGGGLAQLTSAALLVVAAYLGYGACDIVNSLSLRVLGQRVERDTRAELYLSLLSKSQTFLSRQSVGDLMARSTYDVQQISLMVAPNSGLVLESLFALVVPLVTIATLRADLLLVPILFLDQLCICHPALQQRAATSFRQHERAFWHHELRACRVN